MTPVTSTSRTTQSTTVVTSQLTSAQPRPAAVARWADHDQIVLPAELPPWFLPAPWDGVGRLMFPALRQVADRVGQ
jgi:hypothetical protein